ncbi:MAG: hypothetical protein WB697_18010 [Stellaceae bacterium]
MTKLAAASLWLTGHRAGWLPQVFVAPPAGQVMEIRYGADRTANLFLYDNGREIVFQERLTWTSDARDLHPSFPTAEFRTLTYAVLH